MISRPTKCILFPTLGDMLRYLQVKKNATKRRKRRLPFLLCWLPIWQHALMGGPSVRGPPSQSVLTFHQTVRDPQICAPAFDPAQECGAAGTRPLAGSVGTGVYVVKFSGHVGQLHPPLRRGHG